ncbi:hypothetical protein JVT61DRAFT_8146 [Boletus reticuloceps]|uniref:Uncharacterized protein n=1 Tax=Boletus reticuloceps TaxID=495285 RepID=A0A8I2YV76_9AGAM|nr:hypothetical protein JVT61DRAFT_8146 [Boletus reticuloceps]
MMDLPTETCNFVRLSLSVLAVANSDQKSDWAANGLTFILIPGLCLSYAPQVCLSSSLHRVVQHGPQLLRIIRAGTSIGFSPWFLLLGSTSSAAAMLNMYVPWHSSWLWLTTSRITLQYPVIRCCTQISFGKCIEQTAGVFQVGTQWFLFTMILVLYMLYYPPNLKASEWRLSVIVSWIVFLHLAIITLTTFVLLVDSPPSPDPTVPYPPQITLWATFLGVTSGLLAAVQYAPQIIRTYHLKLVGALSIPMMVMQSPGGIVMAISIAIRPGTDWTSWMMYAVSAVMQACLLIMCFAWKIRQRRLGIDDFGRPLGEAAEVPIEEATSTPSEEEDGVSIVIEGEVGDEAAREDTPLLKPRNVVHRGGVLGWIQRLGK